jgi:hypothetical protein
MGSVGEGRSNMDKPKGDDVATEEPGGPSNSEDDWEVVRVTGPAGDVRATLEDEGPTSGEPRPAPRFCPLVTMEGRGSAAITGALTIIRGLGGVLATFFDVGTAELPPVQPLRSSRQRLHFCDVDKEPSEKNAGPKHRAG